MAHSDCGWTCGCAGKTVKSLENTCHTSALLRWWFTTKRRYIKCICTFNFTFTFTMLCVLIWPGDAPGLIGKLKAIGSRTHDHNNHGPVSYYFRVKRRFRSKITNFSHPRYLTLFNTPTEWFLLEFCNASWARNLGWCPYQTVDKVWRRVHLFRYNTTMWQTDRQTDRNGKTISRSTCTTWSSQMRLATAASGFTCLGVSSCIRCV